MDHLSARWFVGVVVATAAVTSFGSVTATAAAATSQTFFVATNGNDANPGTSTAQPLRTLGAAQAKVRQALTANIAPSVQVAGGTYELSQALRFGVADSGSAAAPVAWHAAAGQQVTIVGGRLVTSSWSPDPKRPGVLTTQIGAGLTMDGLLVNGQRQVLARFPNVDPTQAVLAGATNARRDPGTCRALGTPGTGGPASPALQHLGRRIVPGQRPQRRRHAGPDLGRRQQQEAACANPALPMDTNHVVAEKRPRGARRAR